MKYEKEIREIIQEIVDSAEPMDKIGSDMNLQEIGMDSLAFVEIIIEIENRFGIEVPNEDLIVSENGTISNLCGIVDKITRQEK